MPNRSYSNLPYSKRKELEAEARELKKALIGIAQRAVKPKMTPAQEQDEERMIKDWRARLVEVREKLGETLSPSEERMCLPKDETDHVLHPSTPPSARSPQSPQIQIAQPGAALDALGGPSAAMKIDLTE